LDGGRELDLSFPGQVPFYAGVPYVREKLPTRLENWLGDEAAARPWCIGVPRVIG
jgi:hypothetical protein